MKYSNNSKSLYKDQLAPLEHKETIKISRERTIEIIIYKSGKVKTIVLESKNFETNIRQFFKNEIINIQRIHPF